MVEYRDAGYDKNEAFVLVTKHLGRGATRANALIAGLYCQTVAKTFTRMPKKRKLEDAIAWLQMLLDTVYASEKTVQVDVLPRTEISTPAPTQALNDAPPQPGNQR